MTTPKTAIARRALLKLGDRYGISSIDENTPEASAIKEVFEEVQKSMLRDFVWPFAKRFAAPPRLDEDVPAGLIERWQYMYAYPSDAVRVVEVRSRSLNTGGSSAAFLRERGYRYVPNTYAGIFDNNEHFDELGTRYDVVNLDDNRKVLVTNFDDLEIVYVALVDNPDTWDDQFKLAFEYNLAAAVAPALLGDEGMEKQAGLWNQAMAITDKAKSIASSEGEQEEAQQAPWLRARGGF